MFFSACRFVFFLSPGFQDSVIGLLRTVKKKKKKECGVGDSGGDCGGGALSGSLFLLCLFFSWLLHWKGAEFQRLCRNLLCPELYRKQFGNVCAGWCADRESVDLAQF